MGDDVIVFRCDCGQKLNVKRENAGKTFICPKCSAVIENAAQAQNESPAISAPPTKSKPKEPSEVDVYVVNDELKTVAVRPVGMKVIWIIYFFVIMGQMSAYSDDWRYADSAIQQAAVAAMWASNLIAGYLIMKCIEGVVDR